MEQDIKKYLDNLERETLDKLEQIKYNVSRLPYKDPRVRISILNLVNEELGDVLLNWEDQNVPDFDFNDDLD
jgi:hypothetical protein